MKTVLLSHYEYSNYFVPLADPTKDDPLSTAAAPTFLVVSTVELNVLVTVSTSE